MIAFTCQKCGKQYHLKPEFAGRKTTCSGCKEPMIVPAPETAHTVTPEAKARIAFSCTRCSMKFNALAEFAGCKTTCPTCKESLVVPLPDETMAYVPPAGQIDGMASILAQAQVDAGVTLGGGGVKGKSSLQDLMEGKSGAGARYVIEKELARGGMGAILSAIDCDIRREVAVKYLLDQSNAKNKIRFVEEAQITGQLEHPNIVPIHELGLDAQKRIFFTMKMVKGRSLAQVVKMLRDEPAEAEKEYTLSRLLNIFLKVCDALAYAHSRGVVHRDLKPANLMVGDFGEVYVMDWGLAKVLDRTTAVETGPPMALAVATLAGPVGAGIRLAGPAAPLATPVETPPSSATGGVAHSSGSGKVVTSREQDADLTQAGAVLGTPVYMPPEQAAGQIDNIDERSDIYSMGAILYELLTLQPPIDRAGGFWPIVLRVSQGRIEPPEKKAPERARAGKIPVELTAVAMKALAKNKEDRYQTIASLRKDIERFLEGRSVSAKQDTIREMAVKLVRRNKGVSIATTAAAVILAVVGIWSLIAVLSANSRARTEELARREQAKRSVPSFVRAAKLLIAEKEFDDAMAQVDAALSFDETAVDARYVRAQLLLGRQEYVRARTDLKTCWRQMPERDDIKDLLDVAQDAAADNPGTLLAVAEELARQKAYPLAALVTGQAEKLSGSRQELLQHYRARIEVAWPGKGNQLAMSPTGELTLSILQFAKDLEPLRGMPLAALAISMCPEVVDLTPLEGMPLTALTFQYCPNINGLAPLKGMPLKTLNVQGCTKVTDLTPLKGMPLTSLNLTICPVTDLTPLQGMPLKSLNLFRCYGIEDLTPLKGMPLTKLDLTGCGKIKDFGSLEGLPLSELTLFQNGAITDLAPLKGMPLVALTLYECPKITDLTPLKDMPLKSLILTNCQMRDLTPLHGLKLTSLSLGGCSKVRDLTPLQGMALTNLQLIGCPASDLTPLKGAPLTTLGLSGAEVNLGRLMGMPLTSLTIDGCDKLSDLTPLTEMKLVYLNLMHCKNLSDLTPLKGMKIEQLYLAGCPVKDLTPLQGMPLHLLHLNDCKELHDLTPLAGMKLYRLRLPPQVTNGMDGIRAMKTLETIDHEFPNAFWQKWDAAKAK